MSAAEWVTAGAPAALAVGAWGATIYARRTYEAQSKQLDVARQEAARLRAPVLDGELLLWDPSGSHSAGYRLNVRLRAGERLVQTRVVVVEARGKDCPVGFTRGQVGVDQYPNLDREPPEGRGDAPRRGARWVADATQPPPPLGPAIAP